MQIPVENGEMVTVRDAMRTLNQIVDQVQDGEHRRKAVLMKHNQIVAVVLSVDEYRNLLAGRFEGGANGS
jgi:PHD/YefM family antitoxin component YafN of YafNO toxin-antitoxin module